MVASPDVEFGTVVKDAELREVFGIPTDENSEPVVKLAAESSIVCPTHGYLLRRSCRTCGVLIRGIERMETPVSR